MKHMEPPTVRGKARNPEGRSGFSSALCVARKLQRLMPRGLSDRGHLHVFFHSPTSSDCLISLKLKFERPVHCPGVRCAWPRGAGCSSCRCGLEGRHRRAKPGLEMARCAHQCYVPRSPLVEDPNYLSLRASLGRGHGVAFLAARLCQPAKMTPPWYGHPSLLRCQIHESL